MTDLPMPAVPAAAVEAAQRMAPMLGPYADVPDKVDVLGMLTAAWPHLYAAALRHAADAGDSHALGWRLWTDWLRRLADEAAP